VVNFSNSLWGDNTGNECFGTVNSIGANLVEAAGAGCTITGDTVIAADAQLLPLAGVPAVHTFAFASPANGAGLNASCETTDQRGQPRPFPPAGDCDLGAVELGNDPPIFTVLPSN